MHSAGTKKLRVVATLLSAGNGWVVAATRNPPAKTDADDAPLTKIKTQSRWENIVQKQSVNYTVDGTAIIAQICSHWDANLFAESGLYPITYFFFLEVNLKADITGITQV